MKQKNVEKKVMEILTNEPEARCDDHILYIMYVIKQTRNGFAYAFRHYKEEGLPSFESVSRARRKIQANTPELRATSETEAVRLNEEIEYYNYYKE